ncbi:hypothetical protein BH598_23665 [Pseudomonas aeruginosa]|nr:hypothetical protein BH598_23665 [Pseudomonas aeruginosa]
MLSTRCKGAFWMVMPSLDGITVSRSARTPVTLKEAQNLLLSVKGSSANVSGRHLKLMMSRNVTQSHAMSRCIKIQKKRKSITPLTPLRG